MHHKEFYYLADFFIKFLGAITIEIQSTARMIVQKRALSCMLQQLCCSRSSSAARARCHLLSGILNGPYIVAHNNLPPLIPSTWYVRCEIFNVSVYKYYAWIVKQWSSLRSSPNDYFYWLRIIKYLKGKTNQSDGSILSFYSTLHRLWWFFAQFNFFYIMKIAVPLSTQFSILR